MQCFNHSSTAAVGICRACGKGVCARCAADTGVGLACQNACEARVLILGRMVDDNAKVLNTANAQIRSSGLFGVLLGAIFLACGWWSHSQGNQSPLIVLLFGGPGLAFLVFGFVRLTTERYPKGDR